MHDNVMTEHINVKSDASKLPGKTFQCRTKSLPTFEKMSRKILTSYKFFVTFFVCDSYKIHYFTHAENLLLFIRETVR